MENQIWNKIINSFAQNPRDVITVPTTNRKGKWFYVSTDKENVYIQNAKKHKNSCSIKGTRMLNKAEIEKMLDIYHRRQKGECVSAEAIDTTRNQVYWYGIFSDLEL